MQKLPQILEAILFVSGELESKKQLSKILDVTKAKIERAVQALQKDLKTRGLKLLKKGGKIQLVTNPGFAFYLEKYWQKKLRESLSQISLETLAIIAYHGPLSRFEIEDIRGVNSVFVLRNLLRRGLIERKTQGKKVQYQITAAFLRHLGLNSTLQLPRYQEFKK